MGAGTRGRARALSRTAPLACALTCAASLFPLQSAMHARLTEADARASDRLLYLPKEREAFRGLAFGHGGAAADLLFIRANIYVTRHFQAGDEDYRYLYDLYDRMTDLDPSFVDAYRYGAAFLTALADRPQHALDLLAKARAGAEDGPLAGHPRAWEIAWEEAVTHLVYRSDPESAAACLERARALGAPAGVVRLSDRLIALHGSPEARIEIWRRRFEESPPGLQRDIARRSLEHAVTEQRARELVRRADIIAQRTGRRPDSFDELQRFFPDLEEHRTPPAGGIWVFHPNGTITSSGLDARKLERELQQAVTAWHVRTGAWPTSLDDLVREDAIAPEQLAPARAEVTYDLAEHLVHVRDLAALASDSEGD